MLYFKKKIKSANKRYRAAGLWLSLSALVMSCSTLYAEEGSDLVQTSESCTDDVSGNNALFYSDEDIKVSYEYNDILQEDAEETGDGLTWVLEEETSAENGSDGFSGQLLSFEEDMDEMLSDEADISADLYSEEPEPVSTEQDGTFLETELGEGALLAGAAAETALHFGTYGTNLVWKITGSEEAMTLTISGEGEMSEQELPWHRYQNNIVSVIIEDGVTNIRSQAFKDCIFLTGIQISSTVASIGDEAFSGCTALLEYQMPDTVTSMGMGVFSGCNRLSKVTLSSGLTVLSAYTFDGCVSLKTIQLPKNVTEIGGYAFQNCDALVKLVFPTGINRIGSCAFNSCERLSRAELPVSLNEIGTHCFKDCSALKKVTLPAGLQLIGEGTFENCISLEEINIPDTVTVIEENAFANCHSIKNVYYSNSRKQWLQLVRGYYFCKGIFEGNASLVFANVICDIEDDNRNLIADGDYADGDNTGSGLLKWEILRDGDLVYLKISSRKESSYGIMYASYKWFKEYIHKAVVTEGVTMLDRNQFSDMNNLTEVSLPESLTRIGYNAFSNCKGLKSLVLPDNTGYIGNSAFAGCSNLSSIKMPANLYTIEDKAFKNCTNLTAVYLPETTDRIGNEAFYGCSSLTTVVFPKEMESINSYAFYGCENLRGLTLPEKMLLGISSYAFGGCTHITEAKLTGGTYSFVPDHLFSKCKRLKTAIIPSGVEQIRERAFEECGSLQSVIIPASMKRIESYAFFKCGALKDVYFTGTEEEWENITIQYGNKCLTNARIHFDDIISIANAKVMLSHTVLTYNGEYRKPEVTVTIVGEPLTEGENYKVTYRNNKKVGIATVTITGVGRCFGFTSTTFRIRPRTTLIRSLSGETKAFTVKWSKRIKQSDGYHIQYSTVKDFASNRKNIKIYDKETVSRKVQNLSSGKRYYVRIRCFKENDGAVYYSKWCDVGTVKTK